MGAVIFSGYDGTDYRESAIITSNTGSAFSDTNYESYLSFRVTALNSTTPTEQVRVKSNGDLDVYQRLRAGTGTAALPHISFTGDIDTGVFNSAANQLDLVTGGSARFRVGSDGQLYSVIQSQVGTDYATTLYKGYQCRAWVNFNGTGTVAIRASGNVSSITDNGTGDYTVNFTTAMPDVNYSPVYSGGNPGTAFVTQHLFASSGNGTEVAPTVSNFRINIGYNVTSGSLTDGKYVCISIFR
jgi:hypothetical protein